MPTLMPHQYVDRATGRVVTEELTSDRFVNALYTGVRERAPALFRMLTSPRMSAALAWAEYDHPVPGAAGLAAAMARQLGIDLSECEPPGRVFTSPRQLFERQIRYWDVRPMPADPRVVVSPADARLLIGSLAEESSLFLKGKFFDLDDLLGPHRPAWREAFADGDYAVFRLTPEHYHYNHCPVEGVVVDCYEIEGTNHSCNPGAVVASVTPYSKNRRVVTIIDTDVPEGTGTGRVAMIEIVALMIGDIRSCYSARRYDDPQPLAPGLRVRRGQPKSLYRPGSSVDVLLFEKGRMQFDEDILANLMRQNVRSRFSAGFGRSLVETNVRVRSGIGRSFGLERVPPNGSCS